MSRTYLVFSSTHRTLEAEKRLQAAGLTLKVVMKPSAIKIDCGLAIRIAPETRALALQVLTDAGLEPAVVHEM